LELKFSEFQAQLLSNGPWLWPEEDSWRKRFVAIFVAIKLAILGHDIILEMNKPPHNRHAEPEHPAI
jgi:hypothetical protein